MTHFATILLLLALLTGCVSRPVAVTPLPVEIPNIGQRLRTLAAARASFEPSAVVVPAPTLALKWEHSGMGSGFVVEQIGVGVIANVPAQPGQTNYQHPVPNLNGGIYRVGAVP